MGLHRWLTRNVADTDCGTHPDLTPLDLPVDRPTALDRIPAVVAGLPRWTVKAVEPETGTIRLTHRTRLFRFVDDVVLRLESLPSGVRVRGRSKSRVGKGDLGQNRRNLLELFRVLRDKIGPS